MIQVDEYELKEELYYSEGNLWVRIEDGKASIGLTDYAQKQLRDIVFVELPAVESIFKKGDAMGTVESVKAVSDIIAPLSGVVEQINDEMESSPELLNEDPYGEGWLIILNPSKLDDELKELMKFKKAVEWYKKLIQED